MQRVISSNKTPIRNWKNDCTMPTTLTNAPTHGTRATHSVASPHTQTFSHDLDL